MRADRRPINDEVLANLFARAYSDTGSIADAYWVVDSILQRQASTCDVGAAMLNQLIEEVGRIRKVSPQKILGRSRDHRACLARYEIWFKARQATPPLSYPALGAAFERDHSTVMTGVKRFEEMLTESAELRARVTWEVAQWLRAA